MKQGIALFLSAVLFLAVLAGCGSQSSAPAPAGSTPEAAGSQSVASDNPYSPEKPLVWKLNSNQSEIETQNCAQGQAYLHLRDTLEQKTNGAWKVEMYYSSQLGSKTADLVNGAQFGTFQLFNLNCSSWSEYTNAFLALNVPYLFTDEKVAVEFLRGEQGKRMSDQLSADTDISIAFYCPAGFRNTYNNIRPIYTPDDMKGIKMRTMSDKYIIAAFEACGASAMSVPYSELYTALQQGLVDGADNPYLNIYNSKHNEVTKYLSETKNIFSVANLCVANNAYEALPAEWQKLFDETCAECFDIGCNTAFDKSAVEAREYLTSHMQFNTLTDEQFKLFVDKTASVREMAKKELGDEVWNSIEAEIARIEKEQGK